MPKSFLLTFCCVACFLTAVAQDPPAAPTDRDTDSDEVYAAVVKWRIYDPGPAPKPKQLVFLDTTVTYHCPVEPERCPATVRERLTDTFGQALDGRLLEDYFD